MNSDFANVVEEVKKLPSEDKQELKFLLEKYLIEERRTEIYRNYKKSIEELRKNELKFSSDTETLKEILNG